MPLVTCTHRNVLHSYGMYSYPGGGGGVLVYKIDRRIGLICDFSSPLLLPLRKNVDVVLN